MDVTQEMVEGMAPYVKTLGVKFVRLEPHETVAELEGGHAVSTIGGGMHGGALMALADMTATVCSVLNAGSVTTTADATSHFLRPLTGTARATARPLRVGRRLVVVVVDVTDADGALCLHVVQTQAVVESR
ncbi:PaaI family thioesterase [Lentzea sp. NPDC058436]|uniref:PaaI family thioesterase n=1 Tax=Lentzea sp. NPDC058436 TaxID=3346499 RepID=UPI0036605328